MHYLVAVLGAILSLTSNNLAFGCPTAGSNPSGSMPLYLQFGVFPETNVDLGSGVIKVESPGYTGTTAEKEEICERVAEDFSPFDVNVTMTLPTDANTQVVNREAFMVVIGATRAELGITAQGASDVTLGFGFVAIDYPNVTIKSLAQTSSHEFGHMISYHWSVDTYFNHRADSEQNETSASAIMGNHDQNQPELWDKGNYFYPPGSPPPYPLFGEEIGVLGPALGERRDDHGNSPANATDLILINPGQSIKKLQHSGVVGMNLDSKPSCWSYGDPSCPWKNYSWDQQDSVPNGASDWFAFEARNPQSFSVALETLDQIKNLDYAANLFADLKLARLADGSTWQAVNITVNQNENGSAQFSFIPPNGAYQRYAVGVKSRGGYGMIGQYRITVTGPDVRAVP